MDAHRSARALTRSSSLLAGAAVLVVALAGCSSDGGNNSSGPTLKAPSDGSSVGGSIPDVKPGTSILMPLRNLCTTGGPIKIEKVEPVGVEGGLRITSWGTRYLGPETGDFEANRGGGPGVVTDIKGFAPTNPVKAKCTGSEGGDEVNQFDVSVAGRSGRSSMKGVNVYYDGGKRVFAQFDVALCSSSACK